MALAISLDLAVGLTVGHPQDVQMCLTSIRCEIGREMGKRGQGTASAPRRRCRHVTTAMTWPEAIELGLCDYGAGLHSPEVSASGMSVTTVYPLP